MSDSRRPEASILIKRTGKTVSKLELFLDASGFQVREDGRWRRPRGLALNLSQVAGVVRDKLDASFDAPFDADLGAFAVPPAIPQRARVSAPTSYCQGLPLTMEQAVIKTAPILAMDGRWYVGVRFFSGDIVMVAMDDMVIRDLDAAGEE